MPNVGTKNIFPKGSPVFKKMNLGVVFSPKDVEKINKIHLK